MNKTDNSDSFNIASQLSVRNLTMGMNNIDSLDSSEYHIMTKCKKFHL